MRSPPPMSSSTTTMTLGGNPWRSFVGASHVLPDQPRSSCEDRRAAAQNEMRVEGLEAVQLEELNLEDNRLVTIEGRRSLGAVVNSTSKNLITRLGESVPAPSSLSQLSWRITADEPSRACGSPLSDGAVRGQQQNLETREVQHLKTLPKLIIPHGRQPAGDADYRHYVVYDFRRVKVLDGGVEASDLSAAKSKCGPAARTPGGEDRSLLQQRQGTRPAPLRRSWGRLHHRLAAELGRRGVEPESNALTSTASARCRHSRPCACPGTAPRTTRCGPGAQSRVRP